MPLKLSLSFDQSFSRYFSSFESNFEPLQIETQESRKLRLSYFCYIISFKFSDFYDIFCGIEKPPSRRFSKLKFQHFFMATFSRKIFSQSASFLVSDKNACTAYCQSNFISLHLHYCWSIKIQPFP